MDDGANSYKNRYYQLCTNSFPIDDVKFLISCLKRDLNIKAIFIYDREIYPILYIYSPYYDEWVKGITPYITFDCFKHKIKYRESQNTNKSGTIGVYYNKDRDKWEAFCCIDYKKYLLAYCNDKQEAINAREDWLKNPKLYITKNSKCIKAANLPP